VEGGEAPRAIALDGDQRLDRGTTAALVPLPGKDRPAGRVDQRDVGSEEAKAVDLPDQARAFQPGVEKLLVLRGDRLAAAAVRAVKAT
jgi:hypothetical protein